MCSLDGSLTHLWAKIKSYVAGYVSLSNGEITIGSNSITPLTSHQDISGKADKSEMGVSTSGDQTTITLKTGTSATVINAHQSISGKADKATTLAGYGITDAKIANGVITLGSDTITPLTSHQDISGKANTADLADVAFSGAYSDLTGTPTVPTATTTTPKMNGTAAVGSETKWAKGDHVHPTDTSRQPLIDSSHKLSADLIEDGTTNKAYTATEKTKLSGIASGAEVNVVKSVDTTAGTSGINLSLSSAGALDVTISSGSVASGNSNFVTGGTVYSTTSTLAPKASPALTGTPTAPTADAGTNTTQIATTAFVKTAIDNNYTQVMNDVTAQMGVAEGVCPLNASGKIDSDYLPSYVDDVIEAYARTGQTALSSTWLATESASGTVITPEAGKIYILMADTTDYAANTQFRWGGTAYVKMLDGGVSAITTSEIDSITAN